ncbi:hypothetical protein PEC311524_39390 [Pectobacterium carotovorum subsp. carotovorum]|uniref:Uncharacterized protein n=1 Tax=Pectobacterium polonicum TaxID=2485124 RepID=A0ABV1PEK5_9GAMM|nr:hypothetical protein [Pectobacterium polonicum]MDC9820765.1 hypothetical protein [Pectobacterium polonicum]GKW26345.1 hypothetical protein PEC311524_39390 [Pectobacterium carotovorum subsp. carotovorum]
MMNNDVFRKAESQNAEIIVEGVIGQNIPQMAYSVQELITTAAEFFAIISLFFHLHIVSYGTFY